MKIKLDENLGARVKAVFQEEGHDAHTVWNEGLSGASDLCIYEASQREGRVLVTLDHDFGNILRFPYQEADGIIIIEKPEPADYAVLLGLTRVVALALKTRPIKGRLWIVQPGRIRERPAWEEDG